ncbi:MAG: hypothetical protein IPK15_25225 [Verrucomicrobia bacterium]|nr:hypothetical protein [Verrucomicrobiota bacterium]
MTPLIVVTAGTVAPPPRASNRPPKVPLFTIDDSGPSERVVASTSTNRSPASCNCAVAGLMKPSSASAAVTAGKTPGRDFREEFGLDFIELWMKRFQCYF